MKKMNVSAQFGDWAFGPMHGFARIARWHVEKMPERLPSGDVEAIFSLMDDDFTRSMWHFQCVTGCRFNFKNFIGK